jgi:hypothetical protein
LRNSTKPEVWNRVILLVFRQLVEAMWRRYWWWERLADERWQECITAFLEVARRFEVRDQKTPVWELLRKAMFDLLRKRYQDRWRINTLSEPFPEENTDRWTPAAYEPDLSAGVSNDRFRYILQSFIENLIESGRIKESHFRIVRASLDPDYTDRAYAEKVNSTPEAVKKLRQRASFQVFRAMRYSAPCSTSAAVYPPSFGADSAKAAFDAFSGSSVVGYFYNRNAMVRL